MIAAERARLNCVRRPFEIDQRIPMIDLTLLLAHLLFADSISVMIESSVASLFVRHLFPEIGLFNQFASG